MQNFVMSNVVYEYLAKQVVVFTFQQHCLEKLNSKYAAEGKGRKNTLRGRNMKNTE